MSFTFEAVFSSVFPPDFSKQPLDFSYCRVGAHRLSGMLTPAVQTLRRRLVSPSRRRLNLFRPFKRRILDDPRGARSLPPHRALEDRRASRETTRVCPVPAARRPGSRGGGSILGELPSPARFPAFHPDPRFPFFCSPRGGTARPQQPYGIRESRASPAPHVSTAGPAASVRIYYEMSGGNTNPIIEKTKPTTVPVGISYFPQELLPQPKSYVYAIHACSTRGAWS